ncbi:hypothetical protein JY409_04110 [Stenotrophomonas maltophilia]|nr:hypothetical protein [Stenotrophomonas maltophilia]
MKPNLTQAQANHLRRLLGWVRSEFGQDPASYAEQAKDMLTKLETAGFKTSDDAKAYISESYMRKADTPKYVRAAVKALEKLLVKQEGAIVEVEAALGFDAGIEIGGTRHGPLPALLGARLSSAPLPALSAPHPWSEQAPTEPGWYRFTCDEIDGAIERVLVVADRLTGQLRAVDTGMGTLDLRDYHDGLTNPRWQKVECRGTDGQLQHGGRPNGRY